MGTGSTNASKTDCNPTPRTCTSRTPPRVPCGSNSKSYPLGPPAVAPRSHYHTGHPGNATGCTPIESGAAKRAYSCGSSKRTSCSSSTRPIGQRSPEAKWPSAISTQAEGIVAPIPSLTRCGDKWCNTGSSPRAMRGFACTSIEPKRSGVPPDGTTDGTAQNQQRRGSSGSCTIVTHARGHEFLSTAWFAMNIRDGTMEHNTLKSKRTKKDAGFETIEAFH